MIKVKSLASTTENVEGVQSLSSDTRSWRKKGIQIGKEFFVFVSILKNDELLTVSQKKNIYTPLYLLQRLGIN